MDTLKELLDSKTFNRRSYVAVIVWFAFGVLLLGVFALIDAGAPRFSCSVQSENMDNIREKCLEQYEERFNKSGIPVYAFVIVNLCVLAIVCGFYSQVVKSRVERLFGAENQRPPETRRLFCAYCCQLVARCFFAIIFLVLQIQVIYPHNFPSDYNCKLTFATGPRTANASLASIQNTTENIYECRNQRGRKDTAWMYAVIGMNGVFMLFVLIEFICILSRLASEGPTFCKDLTFLKVHLNSQALAPVEGQQSEPDPTVRQGPPQPEEQPLALVPLQGHELRQSEPDSTVPQGESSTELPSSFIESLKKIIIERTKEPLDLEAVFRPKPGEGIEIKNLELDKIYTEVVLTENRAKPDFPSNPKRVGSLPPKRAEDIVDAEYKKILIVGLPGIGKTLFCERILRDWASERLFNEDSALHFRIAFLIKFRRLNSVGELSLRELLESAEFLPTERLPDDVWNCIVENPDKVLILFDGADEYKNHSSIANKTVDSGRHSVDDRMPLHALYTKVAEGTLLDKAAVLTTIRPTAVSSVKYITFTTYEILGFSPQKVEEYVEKFTKAAAGNLSHAGEKIKEHIRKNAKISAFCYIPASCFIICSSLLHVLKSSMETGKDLTAVGLGKLTQIYNVAAKVFFFKRSVQHRDKRLSQSDIFSNEFIGEEEFKHLGEIAFNGLENGRIIFEKSEVEKVKNSSLLYQMPDSCEPWKPPTLQFCFIHLTLQEYFAARHIIDTMKGKELRKFVKDHIEEEGKWEVVFQFVAGLLGERDEQLMEIFTDLLPEETEKKDERKLMDVPAESEQRTFTCWPTKSETHLALTIIKCVYEGSEPNSFVQSKLENIYFDAVDFSVCRLAPADCTAIVHVLKNVQHISLIDFSYNHIGPLGCIEITKLFDNDNSQLTHLNLTGNGIEDEGVKHLSKAIVKSKIESLNLSVNRITDKGLNYLCDKLVNTNLKWLNLCFNFNILVTRKAEQRIQKANPNCKVSFFT